MANWRLRSSSLSCIPRRLDSDDCPKALEEEANKIETSRIRLMHFIMMMCSGEDC